jgi:hypothetical protein
MEFWEDPLAPDRPESRGDNSLELSAFELFVAVAGLQ